MSHQQRRAGKKQGGLPPSGPRPVIEGLLLQASRLHQAGRLPEAVQLYQQILQIDPRHADALHRFGIAAHQMGRAEAALGLIGRAIERDGGHPGYHFDLGNILLEQGHPAQAGICFRRALGLQPGLVEAHNGLANTLKRQDRLDEAEAGFKRALALRPSHAVAYHNLGQTLKEQGRPPDAILAYDRALHLAPDLAETHFAQSLALLQLGAWPQGWRKYEFRWFQPTEPTIRLRRFPQPIWAGDAPRGRTILIWSEQGFGDTLHFMRFVLDLIRGGWKVVMEVQRDLVRLLSGLEGVGVVAAGEALPPFDVHFPLLSLPDRLGVTIDRVPATPHLPLAAEAVRNWRTRLSGRGGLTVGIVWSGSPGHKRDRWRSMTPSAFADFLDQPGVHIVSLQKNARSEELAALPVKRMVCDAGPELGDFADTAALVAALDLVISVDTSVLHLSGALGVPCWGLIDFAPDWRWLTARSDSPWYPSLRLFRQSRRGDWASVTQAVRAELANRVNRPEAC